MRIFGKIKRPSARDIHQVTEQALSDATIKAQCWIQTYKEAQHWPSWDRGGPRLRERYRELLHERGLNDD